MASQLSEIRRHLKKHDWKLYKNGSNHFVFEKDGKLLTIPKGSKMYSRSYKQILWQIEGKACGKNSEQLSLDV